MNKKKHTIKDIAKMAGVSKGTVDRVLHKRGNVSKEAYEKVDKILKKIDFKPNLLARNLKKNKTYLIGVLLPDPKLESYWKSAENGIINASKEFNPFGILVKEYLYDPNSKESFWQQSQNLLESKPDALIMVPNFIKESETILKTCKKANIKVILFNNPINTVIDYVYIGQDLHQSGKLVAGLLKRIINKNDKIAIIHINKEPHMELKEDGFKEYFKEHYSNNHEIISKTFSDVEDTDFKESVSLFLREYPDVAAFFITNAKAYKFLKVFKNETNKDCKIIGYDVLIENTKYLQEGCIDFLIHQKPYRQAYLSVAYVAEHFLFAKSLPTHEYLPIDIITSENAKYHL
ncbi:substrate-binding domain-containing protein [Arenibacter latericius]|uniref:substrate-binding domain-containing protein n=1 Tax=Arenibacter latericius TaxID=86104 RepID=UPI000413B60B|nr:substrate-binding domain-containing protein [Arenibacter latericius]MDX1364247.1 substrate-binding domain-containing protein [Arenibacter latericius]